MKPSIGRIVHLNYFCEGEVDEVVPAIITRVWSDTCVNLGIFSSRGYRIKTSVNAGSGMNEWQWPVVNFVTSNLPDEDKKS